jgi:hypothetical protein
MAFWNLGMILAIVVVAVVDLSLSLQKNKAYFSNGVPIFHQELSAHSPNPKPPSAQSMENGVEKSAFSHLQFHQLGGEMVGFSAAAEGAAFRGLLLFSIAGARLEVTGFANWWVPAILFITAVKAFEFHEPWLFVVTAAVVTLLCIHHAQRCRQVAIVALQQWNA